MKTPFVYVNLSITVQKQQWVLICLDNITRSYYCSVCRVQFSSYIGFGREHSLSSSCTRMLRAASHSLVHVQQSISACCHSGSHVVNWTMLKINLFKKTKLYLFSDMFYTMDLSKTVLEKHRGLWTAAHKSSWEHMKTSHRHAGETITGFAPLEKLCSLPHSLYWHNGDKVCSPYHVRCSNVYRGKDLHVIYD